jgi:Bor protein
MIKGKIIEVKRFALFSILIYCLSGCYSFKIATHAQEGSEPIVVKSKSFFWGLVVNPPTLSTPICDSLNSMGMTEIRVKRTFGNSFATLITLGIYSPATLEYRCSKPCAKPANPL